MDRQRRRVYRWEHQHGALDDTHGRINDLEEVHRWIAQIWSVETSRYGAPARPAPSVGAGRRGRKRAVALVRQRRILLPERLRTRWVILHELAHQLAPLTAARAGLAVLQPHGPQFTGVLIGLLQRHLGLDADLLCRTAADAGVAVAEALIVPEVLNTPQRHAGEDAVGEM